MTEDDLSNPESLVLEHLRHIRAKVDHTAEDVANVKLRMTAIERGMADLNRHMSTFSLMHAGQSERMDAIEARLERLERRAELSD